jgi:hypothetical protein
MRHRFGIFACVGAAGVCMPSVGGGGRMLPVLRSLFQSPSITLSKGAKASWPRPLLAAANEVGA